jgi:FKBP-type peptidyl-prolyl cis-trans isomerase 2
VGAEEAVDWEQVAKAGFVVVSIQGSDGDGCTFPRTADTVTVDYLEKPRAGATGLQKRRTAEFVVGSGSECKGLEEGVRQMSNGEKRGATDRGFRGLT